MAKSPATNDMLLGLHLRFEAMRASRPEDAYLHRKALHQFYQDNGMRVQSIVDKRNDLIKDYFEFENDQTKLGEDGKPIPLEGKTQEEYDKKVAELLAAECYIIE